MERYLKIDLIEKYKNDIVLLEKIKNFTIENSKSNENKELGLKVGDTILFIAGYNNDIEYKSNIVGFDENSNAYLFWDCYWFAKDLKKCLVKKI